VAHTWLHAFGVPEGMCVRPLRELRPRPILALVLSDRTPPSIIAEALADSLRDADLPGVLDVSLEAALATS
ncbi:MAG: hypothetical protein QOE20_2898, partial [Mycobacterium sp.]|nr:hypothetical protein [Mycobacterium sp.]